MSGDSDQQRLRQHLDYLRQLVKDLEALREIAVAECDRTERELALGESAIATTDTGPAESGVNAFAGGSHPPPRVRT